MNIQVIHPVAGASEPCLMADWFTWHAGGRTAVCQLWTHPFGWEVRLEITGDDRRSEVCRSAEAVLTTVDKWMTVLLGTGFQE